MEVRACLRYLTMNPQPSYLRLGRAGEPCLHKDVPEIAPGKWLLVHSGDGSKRSLLTTGATLAQAQQWLRVASYVGYALHSMPLWGMSAKSLQAPQIASWESIVTIEDHLVDGGFGSWIRESLESSPHLMRRISVRALDSKVCGMVGGQETLFQECIILPFDEQRPK
jgi:transketolase